MMFIFKKLVSRFFFPLSLVIVLLLLGTFLKKRRRSFILAGVAILYLCSFSPVGYLILRPFESQYQPISLSSLNKEVRWIVCDATLKRLLEGVRLCRLLPEARLVLSGGDYRGISPDAEIMQQVALDYGVARERILLEAASRDTAEQATFLRDRMGQAPFYLVTSATHMMRAMKMFKRAGTQPIAAPTDFHAVSAPFQVTDFFPQAGILANTERAFNEYLGLCWGWVRGQV